MHVEPAILIQPALKRQLFEPTQRLAGAARLLQRTNWTAVRPPKILAWQPVLEQRVLPLPPKDIEHHSEQSKRPGTKPAVLA